MPEEHHAPTVIDTDFDFRKELPVGQDPDSWSPTLRRYHRLLWSKPLPSGEPFNLIEAGQPGGHYLRHESALGAFRFTSDAITHRYLNAPVVKKIPADDVPLGKGYTIGSALIFPGIRIDGKQTINMARGAHPRIRDRFDLTLECIRRYYRSEESPLDTVLQRYADFFALFENFRGTSTSSSCRTSLAMEERLPTCTHSMASRHRPSPTELRTTWRIENEAAPSSLPATVVSGHMCTTIYTSINPNGDPAGLPHHLRLQGALPPSARSVGARTADRPSRCVVLIRAAFGRR